MKKFEKMKGDVMRKDNISDDFGSRVPMEFRLAAPKEGVTGRAVWEDGKESLDMLVGESFIMKRRKGEKVKK